MSKLLGRSRDLVRMVGDAVSCKASHFLLFLYKQLVLFFLFHYNTCNTWPFLGLCPILESHVFHLIKYHGIQEGDVMYLLNIIHVYPVLIDL